LTSISEETQQLSKMLTQENELMQQLYVSIRQILKRINVSFNISPQQVPTRQNTRKIILNKEGQLMLFYENGKTHSGSLADYPPETVVAVLRAMMPKLIRIIRLQKSKIHRRISFFKRVKKELRNIVEAMTSKEKEM